MIKLNPQTTCTFTFQRVSSKEIKDVMKKLNRKKAQRYDEIPTSFIKDDTDILAKPLVSLINRCLENSPLPSAEKCAKITPAHNCKERSLLDNYRPISILLVLSKVFERVVHRNRTQFIAFEGVESSVQVISCGVPQGSILGSLLFVLVINYIDIHLERCEIILYADDTVIYYADRTCERIEEHLNNDMEQISNWLVQNNLVINFKCSDGVCSLWYS